MPRHQGRVRQLQVPAGVLDAQWSPASYLSFWIAAPAADHATCSLLGATLVAAVSHLHLAGQDLLCYSPSWTKLTLRNGEQGCRISLSVAVDARQKAAALELVEPATAHIRLPASAAQSALPGPVRLALDGRHLVRLHTSGWPPLTEPEQVKLALEQAQPHGIEVLSVEQPRQGSLVWAGEFLISAFLPSKHPSDIWRVRCGATISAEVRVKSWNGPAPPAAPRAGWQAAAAAVVGRPWPPRAPWAPAAAGPPRGAPAQEPPSPPIPLSTTASSISPV
jgi:hypothetical protein